MKNSLFKFSVYFLTFDFFLPSTCATEQWLVYHSLKYPDLDQSTPVMLNLFGTVC